MPGHGEKSHKQEAAIAALLNQPTLTEAAAVCGLNEATLRRWLKEERFQTSYKEARRAVLDHAVARLQHVTEDAVTTLGTIMQDTVAPANARVTASRTVLEFAFKAMDHDALEQRLATLEAALAQQQKEEETG